MDESRRHSTVAKRMLINVTRHPVTHVSLIIRGLSRLLLPHLVQIARGSSLDLDVTAKMTVRALYFFVVGFSGLFAMQGCGGGSTTAAAAATTASP